MEFSPYLRKTDGKTGPKDSSHHGCPGDDADPVSVEPDMGIEVVAGLMVDNGFHTIPVVDEGRLVGIVGKEDVLEDTDDETYKSIMIHSRTRNSKS